MIPDSVLFPASMDGTWLQVAVGQSFNAVMITSADLGGDGPLIHLLPTAVRRTGEAPGPAGR